MQFNTMAALAGSALLAGLASIGPAAAQGNLTVYCVVQEEWCQAMVNAFQAETGITVAMTRKSSGETYAQVAAEAANPRGDIWWGGTGDPHLQAAEEGLTEPYESPMMSELHDWAIQQHKISGGRTVGIYLGALGYGYNTEIIEERGIEPPACWADLIKPEFEGEVQVANPNSSGTAYTFLATLVQIMGEEEAFEYLRALDANVNQYTKSGAAPGQAAARGETAVGITFLHDIITPIVTTNAPLKPVAPCEGTGFEIGSMSIIKGAQNLENAKKWYDWALTADAQAIGAQANSYQNPSNKNAPIPEVAPDMSEIKLIDYDFAKFGSSEERQRLLSKWDAEIGG
jgi:iron(III) transport system substrate-binding protein